MNRAIEIFNLKKGSGLTLALFRRVKHHHYDVKGLSTAAGIHGTVGQEKKLGSLFSKLIGLNEYSDVSGLNTIKSLPRRIKLEEAIANLEEMEGSGVTPRVYTCKTLVEGLCLHGKTSSAYEMLQACREKGVPIDISVYNVLIRGYCNEMRIKEADHVLQDMKKHRVAPNAQTYASLIHGYCKSANISRAMSLHDEMLSDGIKTNCIILNSILQCSCEMDMSIETLEQFQRFKNAGRTKWGLSLMLSLQVHDFKEMDLHVRQLSYSGMADTYLEAKERSRRCPK